MGREGEVAQALTPAFERANPGVRVEVQQLPWSAAHAKLLTAFASICHAVNFAHQHGVVQRVEQQVGIDELVREQL